MKKTLELLIVMRVAALAACNRVDVLGVRTAGSHSTC
jgi:hypothetical protein